MKEFNVSEWLIEKANELARKHADIIEQECKMLCDQYNVKPQKLIIKYYQTNKIAIDIKGVEFEINNVFTYGDE